MGLLVNLCEVNLLDAWMPCNFSENSAIPAAHHQHLLWLTLLHQQGTASSAVTAEPSTSNLVMPAGAGPVLEHQNCFWQAWHWRYRTEA